MTKNIKIALALVAGSLGAFVALVSSRPDDFHVERSARVDAPADAAFSLVNDFHQWARWSPYEKLDPTMKKTFDGAPSGVGATYAWAGNDKSGEGRMTIVESKPGDHVSIKLEFTKPFAATNTATFTFTPSETGTQVRWAMDGKNGFLGKAIGLVCNMDAMVGKDFEEGLVNLGKAAQVESEKTKQAAQIKPAAGAAPPAATP